MPYIIHTFNLNISIQTVELMNSIMRKRVRREVQVGDIDDTLLQLDLKTRGGHCIKLCVLDNPKNRVVGKRNVFRFPSMRVRSDS
jgi:hypothetical protein